MDLSRTGVANWAEHHATVTQIRVVGHERSAVLARANSGRIAAVLPSARLLARVVARDTFERVADVMTPEIQIVDMLNNRNERYNEVAGRILNRTSGEV